MDKNCFGFALSKLFKVSITGPINKSKNVSLIISCIKDTFEYQYAFIETNAPEINWLYPDPEKESIYIFPLYADDGEMINKTDTILSSNLHPKIVDLFAKKLFLPFGCERENMQQDSNSPVCYVNSEEVSEDFRINTYPRSFVPIDLFDYVYAILHSGKYKEKYKQELKEDFPLIPLPKNQITFWELVTLGKKVRKLHLLEGPEVENYTTQFPVDGENRVNKIHFDENYEIIHGNDKISTTSSYAMGRVYINEKQFFEKVPKLAWEFSLGNHHPAREWLENKMGSVLTTFEIVYFQKIIVALVETKRIQIEIDALSL